MTKCLINDNSVIILFFNSSIKTLCSSIISLGYVFIVSKIFLNLLGFHVFGESTIIFSIIISDNSGISITLLNTPFNSSISSFDNSDFGVICPVITEIPLSLFRSILTNFSPHASAKVLIK